MIKPTHKNLPLKKREVFVCNRYAVIYPIVYITP